MLINVLLIDARDRIARSKETESQNLSINSFKKAQIYAKFSLNMHEKALFSPTFQKGPKLISGKQFQKAKLQPCTKKTLLIDIIYNMATLIIYGRPL